MLINEVQEHINEQEYIAAREKIECYKSKNTFVYDDITAVLEAAIYCGEKDNKHAMECIYKGLLYNPANYELYFMLANIKRENGCFEQANLSYENALFLASEEDFPYIQEEWELFKRKHNDFCKKVSIVLITYNQLQMTQLCVESIRFNMLCDSYEIIVVDNLSTDGTREWLLEQDDIIYELNEENRGFPAACNQGVRLANRGNDIFILNNDTIVWANSIYNLRMALYEEAKNAATGACSNYVSNRQQIEQYFSSVDDYAAFAKKNNSYNPERHEYRIKLVGFAIMVKYSAWELVGGMDECYGMGNFEDDDISLKLLLKGFRLIFCPDSFIYHFGSSSFKELEAAGGTSYDKLLRKNSKKFSEKWNINWNYYIHTRDDILGLIQEDRKKEFAVLDIGCAGGATMLKLQGEYRNAKVYGVELEERVAEFASHYLDVVQKNIEDKNLEYDIKFDYIILADVLEHLHDPEDILLYLKSYLKDKGYFLLSIPNVQHYSVVIPLLQGRFMYQDSGVLDKTHLRFFTLTEIITILNKVGLEVEKCASKNRTTIEEWEKDYIDRLCEMDSKINKEELLAYQWILKVKLN